MVEETEKAKDSEGWERSARVWLSTLPEGHSLSMSEVENWVNSNQSYDDLKSLSQSHLLQHFSAILTSLQPNTQEVSQANRGENPARFQRTDQWRPVYSWLESLDLDDVIKSKDISDWLAANPEICDQLCSRHSRHHLMHYVKKCHIKILKKRKGAHYKPQETTPMNVDHLDVPKPPATIPSNPLMNVPKDSDLYRVKRDEALRKYEILVELEKQLSAVIPKQNAPDN